VNNIDKECFASGASYEIVGIAVNITEFRTTEITDTEGRAFSLSNWIQKRGTNH
jgi:hypothetical protein